MLAGIVCGAAGATFEPVAWNGLLAGLPELAARPQPCGAGLYFAIAHCVSEFVVWAEAAELLAPRLIWADDFNP